MSTSRTSSRLLPITLGVGAAIALSATLLIAQPKNSDATPPATLTQSDVQHEYNQAVEGSIGDQYHLPAGYTWPELTEATTDQTPQGRTLQKQNDQNATLTYTEGVGTSQAIIYYQWTWQKAAADAHAKNDTAGVDEALTNLEAWTKNPLTKQYYENPEEWASDALEPARSGDFTLLNQAAQQPAPQLPTIESLGDL